MAGDLQRTVLAVFDAHNAFPILTLRLLRSGGASKNEVSSPSSSSVPTPGCGIERSARGKGGAAADGSACGSGVTRGCDAARGDDVTEDWTIVSGGGDGGVAHWTVVGLASASEVADGVAEAGVELQKIGGYEVCFLAGDGLNGWWCELGLTSQDPRTNCHVVALTFWTVSVFADSRVATLLTTPPRWNCLLIPQLPYIEYRPVVLYHLTPRCIPLCCISAPLDRRRERAGVHAIPLPVALKETALAGASSPQIESQRFRISWWRVYLLGVNYSATERCKLAQRAYVDLSG